jgi:ATP-dependent Clp protease ATP-binding subunit ClpX
MPKRTAYCSFCRKDYRDAGPLVEGPGEVYICGECIDLCQSIIQQEKRRRGVSRQPLWRGTDPAEIEERLGRCLTMEPTEKRLLSAAVHNHYRCLSKTQQEEQAIQATKCNILLVGPSLSSKLFLARALASILNVPFAHGDASALGTPWQDRHPIFRLVEAANYDFEAAEQGVVYLEGIDEQGIREPLLEVLDGEEVILSSGLRLHTANMLVIAGGRFDNAVTGRDQALQQSVAREDLLASGTEPEIIDRFQVFIRLAPLDEETLARILSMVNLDRLSGEDA